MEKMAPATLSGKDMIKKISSFSLFCKALLLLSMSGCYKNHLYVQQERIDRTFLASSYVGTPDPRQAHPPEGQRLLIAWRFPYFLFQKELTLVTTVRLWNLSQEVFCQPLEQQRGSVAYYFPDDLPSNAHRILTYRLQVFDQEGEEIETWEHHFWTDLIDVDQTILECGDKNGRGPVS